VNSESEITFYLQNNADMGERCNGLINLILVKKRKVKIISDNSINNVDF
jgi:hypothetical protein